MQQVEQHLESLIQNDESVNDEYSQKSLMRLATASAKIESLDQFKEWMASDVREFFPFGMMMCALGRKQGSRLLVDAMIGVSYPEAFIRRIARTCEVSDRRVISRWVDSMHPQLIDADQADRMLTPLELKEFREFRLLNIAAYGFVDIAGMNGSYFSFSRIPGKLTLAHARRLELLTPYLHQALLRVHRASRLESEQIKCRLLSSRECDVLALMARGMTNREIAAFLDRSVLTIQNQVHHVLVKLAVRNRAHAVVRAMEMGMVQKE